MRYLILARDDAENDPIAVGRDHGGAFNEVADANERIDELIAIGYTDCQVIEYWKIGQLD